MGKTADKLAGKSTGLVVLALGLIIGFVVCFIMILSRLPVDAALQEPLVALENDDSTGFQFYNLLKRQTTRSSVVEEVASDQRVVAVGTRPVPPTAQRINRRALAAENYAEIPASSIGQESYYLQAGNFVSPADAERARAAVAMLGLESFVVKRAVNGRVGHRVRIGPFFDQRRLNDAQHRLRQGKIGFEIIRVAGFRPENANN